MARTKYGLYYCAFCNKSVRMEIVGGAHTNGDKTWCRCTRCHHMSLLNPITKTEQNSKDVATMDSATMYSPELSFNVGDSIFHTEWNDVGKVLNKIRTSDGNQAIVVSFEKQGQRTLIENLKA